MGMDNEYIYIISDDFDNIFLSMSYIDTLLAYKELLLNGKDPESLLIHKHQLNTLCGEYELLVINCLKKSPEDPVLR